MSEKPFENLFLSVGAMKAGTTWLYSVLERHPDLYFTPEKEIHYFYYRFVDSNILSDTRRLTQVKRYHIPQFDPHTANTDRIRQNLRWVADYLTNPVDDMWYRTIFASKPQQSYCCDFSNLYALLPADAWSRIAADTQKLRILYTMRHPIKRLWSHVKFDLEINNKTDLLATWGPRDFDKFARQSFLWNNAEYGKVLGNMKAGLSAETFMPIFFEDLHADKRGTLAKIEDFLGIGHFNYPEPLLSKRVNESISYPMPDFFPGLFQKDMARIIQEVKAAGMTPPESWAA